MDSKKARRRRAEIMRRFQRTGKVITGTYRDCQLTEEPRTDSRTFPEYLLPVLKDWRSGTDMHKLVEAQEVQDRIAEEYEISALLAAREPHSSFQE